MSKYFTDFRFVVGYPELDRFKPQCLELQKEIEENSFKFNRSGGTYTGKDLTLKQEKLTNEIYNYLVDRNTYIVTFDDSRQQLLINKSDDRVNQIISDYRSNNTDVWDGYDINSVDLFKDWFNRNDYINIDRKPYRLEESYTMNKKLSLEEATIKNLYDSLESEKPDDVDGIVDDILVVTDTEVTPEEYQEVIDRAQEIVEDTPEGEIPFDEDYIGEYAQICPICGSTFIDAKILQPGDTCPVCYEQPESFVLIGTLQNENIVDVQNGIEPEDSEESIDQQEDIPVQNEEDTTLQDIKQPEEEPELERDVASKQITGNNKLTESNDSNSNAESISISGLENYENIVDKFEYYNAYKANFGPLVIVKVNKIYYIFKADAKDYNDYIDYTTSKDYIEGWMHGAVKAKNKILESLKESEKKEIAEIEDQLDNDKTLKGDEIIDLQNDIKYIKDKANKEKRQLTETGEWDDNDEDMNSWKEDLKSQAQELALQVNGEVKSVHGFDKYQGPFAVVNTPNHGDVVLMYDTEDDTGLSFVCKVAHVGWISGGINNIAKLLNEKEIPENEILTESYNVDGFPNDEKLQKYFQDLGKLPDEIELDGKTYFIEQYGGEGANSWVIYTDKENDDSYIRIYYKLHKTGEDSYEGIEEITGVSDLRESKKAVKESKFDQSQATLPLDNYQSIGIIISKDGSTVQYMYSDDDNSVYESDIEYDDNSRAYFKDENGDTWYLDEFIAKDKLNTLLKERDNQDEDAHCYDLYDNLGNKCGQDFTDYNEAEQYAKNCLKEDPELTYIKIEECVWENIEDYENYKECDYSTVVKTVYRDSLQEDKSNDTDKTFGKWRVEVVVDKDGMQVAKFYDVSQDPERFPGGQFVSSYYVETLMGDDWMNKSIKDMNILDLYSEVPSWKVEKKDLQDIYNWLLTIYNKEDKQENVITESKQNNTELHIGDTYKGKVDGSLMTITNIDTDKDKVTVSSNGRTFTTGIEHFKHLLLDKIDESYDPSIFDGAEDELKYIYARMDARKNQLAASYVTKAGITDANDLDKEIDTALNKDDDYKRLENRAQELEQQINTKSSKKEDVQDDTQEQDSIKQQMDNIEMSMYKAYSPKNMSVEQAKQNKDIQKTVEYALSQNAEYQKLKSQLDK